MQIAFYSMTGNIRRFLSATGAAEHFELYEIKESNKEDVVAEPFILVTSTYGFGQVPDTVRTFLENNHDKLLAVASSGNRNWGQNFAKSGEYIRDEYGVPLLMKFELHGSKTERKQFMEKVGNFYESTGREKVQPH